VWRKFAPVVVLCPNGKSPFASGVVTGSDQQKQVVCNVCTPQMEWWGMKTTNLFSNYTVPNNDYAIGAELLKPSTDYRELQRITLDVARSMDSEIFRGTTPETWKKMQATLHELMLKVSEFYLFIYLFFLWERLVP
jgi:hypothetical protein